MFQQVPVLPVVIPLAAAVSAALVLWLRRRGRLSVPRAGVALALGVYLAGVVANTVFPIYVDKPTSSAPWTGHLVLVPFVDYEVSDAVLNILVFVPVGMLVSLILARASWGRVIAAAAAFSLTIEVTQYVSAHLLGGGHIADVNDLFFNVVGGAVGFAVLSALSLVPRLRDVIDRFRWHSGHRDTHADEAVRSSASVRDTGTARS